jgi:hypothetical protein
MVIRCAAARIGPHRLELDLPRKLGDGPPAAQNGGAFPQPACPLKNPFLLGVYHPFHWDAVNGATIYV